jgi:DNA-binding transcriptional MerR regulator
MTQSTSEGTEVRYKIGDVCRIADVQPYVLRYWESEFPSLTPDRSIPGPRTYNAREVELIGQIKRLLYDEGYTIAGAKKRIESEAGGARSRDTMPAFIPVDDRKREKSDAAAEGGKPDKVDKPDKAGRVEKIEPIEPILPADKPSAEKTPEKTVKPPERPAARRAPSRPGAPLSADTLPGLGDPGPALSTAADEPAGAGAARTPDPRVEHAIAELKEILGLLSRAE